MKTQQQNGRVEGDRKLVRQFFEFKHGDPSWEPGAWQASGIAALLFGGGLGSSSGSWIAGTILGVAIFGGCWVIVKRWVAAWQEARKNEFGRLAQNTKAVQSSDVIRAYLRIFDRSQLNRQEIRILENKYIFSKERDLFSEATLEEKMGDLRNKSIRLIARADFTNKFTRKVKWSTGKTETFYNPLQLVAIFLTNEEIIVCDAAIDSVDGDLRETILRIMLSDIVSVGFSSSRVRLPVNAEALLTAAKDLRLPKKEFEAIEAHLKSSSNAAGGRDFVEEESTSHLEITRTDGGILKFPIKSDIFVGWHVSALDQDVALTDDELAVDRMVNELNRVVRSSRQRVS